MGQLHSTSSTMSDVVCGYDVQLLEPAVYSECTLQLDLASHRFITFPRYWNHMNNRHELVDAGFFFCINRSQVQCYFCNTCVKVKEGLNIIEQHNSYAPDCSMLLGIAHDNRPMMEITNYRYESDRLLSFLIDPWMYNISPYALAENGFFSTGEEDNVRCAFCRLEVRGWNENDTAREEHIRWKANCPFLKQGFVGNISLSNELEEREFFTQEDASKLSLSLTQDGINQEDLNIIKRLQVKHPEYLCTNNRLKSFKYWPKHLPTRPEQLSAAGFVYTNIGDRAYTFCCNTKLSQWTPGDDPWEQHARWSFGCQFLQLMKGSKFIAEVKKTQIRDLELKEDEEPMNTDCEDVCAVNDLTCKVCCVKKSSICVLPCGHLATCESCIIQVKSNACVLCRTKILGYVRVYV
jgi:baculoviral IAP repeat-containing protein 7/8